MRNFRWSALGALLALFVVSAHADTYSLFGVTLADGGTITGHFDWNDVPSSYAYTNVDITVMGGGAELGSNVTITAPDLLNIGGLCLVEPAVTQGACNSSALPSLALIFDQRLSPNALSPTDPKTISDQICIGSTSCFLSNESKFTFPDGASVPVTAGSVVNTTVPEPGTWSTALLGILTLAMVPWVRRHMPFRS